MSLQTHRSFLKVESFCSACQAEPMTAPTTRMSLPLQKTSLNHIVDNKNKEMQL